MVDLRIEGREVLLNLQPGERYIDETATTCVVDRIIDGCIIVSHSAVE
jgi:hypothetical protein